MYKRSLKVAVVLVCGLVLGIWTDRAIHPISTRSVPTQAIVEPASAWMQSSGSGDNEPTQEWHHIRLIVIGTYPCPEDEILMGVPVYGYTPAHGWGAMQCGSGSN